MSAAAAFARALPDTSVTLIDCASGEAALADMLPVTLPGVERFHAAIGLDEGELVGDGIAVHHLGTIFEGWSGDGERSIQAFGNYGKPLGAIPFDQVWWRARVEGQALPYERYSVAAGLARAGKFVHPARDSQSLGSRFQYGLRLDPELYRDRLTQLAAALGVAIIKSDIEEMERGEQGLAALSITSGDRLEADLFIDCTGPSARLLSAVDDSFEDWSEWMPFDRLELQSEAASGSVATADFAKANDDGWSVSWPLRGRTIRARLTVGGAGVRITRGRRLRPWVGNVLALGDAATALDPLHGTNLDAAQRAILLALELLPGRDFNRAETHEYNRRAEQLTRRVRDFVALHYLCSHRTSGTWKSFSGRELPDSLARTLDQYVYRLRLPFHEEETVTRDSWTAALIGIGMTPAHQDPQAAGVPLETIVPPMRQLAVEIEQAVAALPSYANYLSKAGR